MSKDITLNEVINWCRSNDQWVTIEQDGTLVVGDKDDGAPRSLSDFAHMIDDEADPQPQPLSVPA